jgi:hypothetical protein
MCISLSFSPGIEGKTLVFIISLLSILNKQMGQIIRPPEEAVPLYIGFGCDAPEGAAPLGASGSLPIFISRSPLPVLFLLKNLIYSL